MDSQTESSLLKFERAAEVVRSSSKASQRHKQSVEEAKQALRQVVRLLPLWVAPQQVDRD